MPTLPPVSFTPQRIDSDSSSVSSERVRPVEDFTSTGTTPSTVLLDDVGLADLPRSVHQEALMRTLGFPLNEIVIEFPLEFHVLLFLQQFCNIISYSCGYSQYASFQNISAVKFASFWWFLEQASASFFTKLGTVPIEINHLVKSCLKTFP